MQAAVERFQQAQVVLAATAPVVFLTVLPAVVVREVMTDQEPQVNHKVL